MDTSAVWLAGYLDGDGSISMTKVSTSRFRKPVVSFSSCDREIIAFLREEFGGVVVTKTPKNPNGRPVQDWRLTGIDRVQTLLRRVYPYLRCHVKKERARILLEEWVHTASTGKKFDQELTKRKFAVEDKFYAVGEDRGYRRRHNVQMPERQSELAVNQLT